MKKMVLVIALAAIALGGSAFAQDPNYFNNIGVYMDETGTTNCATVPLSTVQNAYLVLSQLTANEVLAWEAKVTFDNMFVLGYANRGQAIDVGSRPDEHVVGFASPLPAAGGVVVVADIQFMVTSASPAYAFVDEIYFSLLENGLPAYLDADSNGITLRPALGGVADPVFIVNGDCGPVAVEETSFGSVKSLFR